jgi:hypothetical protein
LEGVELKTLVEEIIEEVTDELVDGYAPKEARPDAWRVRLSHQGRDARCLELFFPSAPAARLRQELRQL